MSASDMTAARESGERCLGRMGIRRREEHYDDCLQEYLIGWWRATRHPNRDPQREGEGYQAKAGQFAVYDFIHRHRRQTGNTCAMDDAPHPTACDPQPAFEETEYFSAMLDAAEPTPEQRVIAEHLLGGMRSCDVADLLERKRNTVCKHRKMVGEKLQKVIARMNARNRNKSRRVVASASNAL